MRRFLFGLLITALVVLLIGVLYVFFTKKTPTGGRTFTYPTNPFGQAGNKAPTTDQNATSSPSNTENQFPTNNENTSSSTPFQALEKVWDRPVAGFSFVYLPILISSTSTDKKGKEIIVQTRATSSLLYFVEKETGNIYKKDLDTGTTTRITNTTIPNVHDAYFLSNGKYVVLRTYTPKQKRIQTFIASVPQVLIDNDPLPLGKAVFLPDTILSLIPSYTGSQLYYLVEGASGATLYSWSEAKGNVYLSNVPLNEILLSVSKAGVYATTKASAFVKGYMMSLPGFVPLYGNKTGLTTFLSPSSEFLLSSMWSSTGLVTYIHSLSSGKDTVTTVKTLAEKCAWDTTSSYALCGAPDVVPPSSYGLPDDWYQGETHFRDSLYLLGAKIPSESKIFDLSDEAKEDIDLIHPALNALSTSLVFINKNNESLWLLRTGYILNPSSNNP